MSARQLVRMAARTLTGYTYSTLGMDAFREPGGRVSTAAPALSALRKVVPLPEDDELLVRANGLTQAVAGGLLAAGVAPRLMAAVIAGTLVPTTLAGHAFWKIDDPAAKAGQRVQFRKNSALLGGLLFCLLDDPARDRRR